MNGNTVKGNTKSKKKLFPYVFNLTVDGGKHSASCFRHGISSKESLASIECSA
jgi:hypothetical protein